MAQISKPLLNTVWVVFAFVTTDFKLRVAQQQIHHFMPRHGGVIVFDHIA
ncbi:Uncharacterised protein [Vibrio cholerae]|nr:Uncharacterised protein [Vibrio cholerae]